MGARWTERRIALLKQLWSEGKTAGRIAAELGDISRSAVLGKVFRLRLGRPRHKTAPAPARSVRAAPVRRRRRPQPIAPKSTAEPKQSAGRTLLELTNDSCRYPIGEPGTPDFHFCGAAGADLENDRPYCETHMRLAYVGGGKARGTTALRDVLAMTSPPIVPAGRRGQRIIFKTLGRRG